VYNLKKVRVGGSWQFSSMEDVEEMIPALFLNISLVRIHRFKERSIEIEQQVDSTALKVGVGGVVVVCVACLAVANAPAIGGCIVAQGLLGATTTEAAAAALAAKTAAVIAGGAKVVGAGGAMAAGVAVAAEVTSSRYAFHEFVVFECSDGYYLSIEKNNQHVSIQISTDWDQIITFKDGIEHSRDPEIAVRRSSDVRRTDRNRRPTIKDVLREAAATPEYGIVTCNCHHFAGHLMNKFAPVLAGLAGHAR